MISVRRVPSTVQPSRGFFEAKWEVSSSGLANGAYTAALYATGRTEREAKLKAKLMLQSLHRRLGEALDQEFLK